MTGRRTVRWFRLLAVSAAVVQLGVWSGVENVPGSRAQESGVYHKFQTYDGDQNHKNTRKPLDGMGLTTSEGARAPEERTAQRKKKTRMDAAVVTAYNDGSRTAGEYVDDFYDRDGLGTGGKANGVLFLIYMGNPSSYGDEGYVSATGNTIRILANRRIEQIQDDVAYPLRDFNYTGAAAKFLKNVEYYVDRRIQRGQYNYDTETGEINIYRSIRWYEETLALLVSARVAGSVCLGVKRWCSMERIEREKANSLLVYRVNIKFAFGDSRDNLTCKFITSVSMLGPTQNHSPGGSGQSSGRSSTHRSSSGRSRGGGGRRF